MVLITLLASNAYAEKIPNRPFKVCPEVAKLTDYPCVAMGPVATIVHRMEKPDPRDKQIEELKAKIKILEEMLEKYVNPLRTE